MLPPQLAAAKSCFEGTPSWSEDMSFARIEENVVASKLCKNQRIQKVAMALPTYEIKMSTKRGTDKPLRRPNPMVGRTGNPKSTSRAKSSNPRFTLFPKKDPDLSAARARAAIVFRSERATTEGKNSPQAQFSLDCRHTNAYRPSANHAHHGATTA